MCRPSCPKRSKADSLAGDIHLTVGDGLFDARKLLCKLLLQEVMVHVCARTCTREHKPVSQPPGPGSKPLPMI